MERMTAREYKALLDGQKKPKYRVAPKDRRTWKGKFRGREQEIIFDSASEMHYCIGLILQQRSGQIKELSFQESFLLTEKTNDERQQVYKADFCYFDNISGYWLAGDVKSKATRKDRKYINKRKLFKKLYPNIKFKEVVL